MSDLTIYSDEELLTIQKLERDALKVIMDVCASLSIEYFLIGGSALGVVRHGGFIPWDDDIDVGMTRENYLRFLAEAPALLPAGYTLQTPYADHRVPYYYTKLRIDGTRFVEYCNHRVEMHHGVYVDIFPFDEVPDDDAENQRQFDRVQRLFRLFSFRQSPDVSMAPETSGERLRAAVRRVIHCAARLIPYRAIAERLEREITQYNGTGQSALACLNFPKRKTEYILRADLYPLALSRFDELEVPIPGNYDAYLKTHYGDYMRLPPEKQRFGHKPYVIDLGAAENHAGEIKS